MVQFTPPIHRTHAQISSKLSLSLKKAVMVVYSKIHHTLHHSTSRSSHDLFLEPTTVSDPPSQMSMTINGQLWALVSTVAWRRDPAAVFMKFSLNPKMTRMTQFFREGRWRRRLGGVCWAWQGTVGEATLGGAATMPRLLRAATTRPVARLYCPPPPPPQCRDCDSTCVCKCFYCLWGPSLFTLDLRRLWSKSE